MSPEANKKAPGDKRLCPGLRLRGVALDGPRWQPLDSVRIRMIIEPESARATASKFGAAVLVEDAAGTLLLDFRRGCELWGLPGGRVEGVDTDALW